MLTLGIDAGGTATRYVLLDAAADRIIARGEAGGCSGHIFDPAVRARATAAVAAITTAALGHGRPERIAGGITGLGGGTPEAAEMGDWLAEACRLPASAVTLGDDMWIAAASLFPPGGGGILYAGTGSVGYAIDRDGRAVKVGGRGVVIDDAGAAYWIAAQGLRALLREEDEGRGMTGPMAEALAEAIGAADWPTIRVAVYGADRGGVAALAPFVARAAEAGDPAARAILAQAGRELARLGAALARRFGLARLALLGGAFRLHPLIAETLKAALPPGVAAAEAEIDAPLAAARLAATGAVAPVGT
jgi:N-acetylglucosamine kinase-like BadF-type ATPase